MTDKQKPITAERIRQMREYGFVAYRESDGRIAFVADDIFAEMVAAGELTPGASVQ